MTGGGDAMDRAVAVIKEFIREYAQVPPTVGDIEMETVFDEERGHYQLMMQGWDRWKRVHGSLIHVDVRGDKVYVQHDGTEEGIANRLTQAGFPTDRIVLCFHHPDKRSRTPFAAA
jgi:hypothetical protein